MKTIKGLTGKYFPLSNCYPCPVEYCAETYTCAEAAFWAQLCPHHSKEFRFLTAVDAKRLATTLPMREDWQAGIDDVMFNVIAAKIGQNRDIEQLLLETGDAEILDVNMWGDPHWSMTSSGGQNMLGKTLMLVRERIRELDTQTNACEESKQAIRLSDEVPQKTYTLKSGMVLSESDVEEVREIIHTLDDREDVQSVLSSGIFDDAAVGLASQAINEIAAVKSVHERQQGESWEDATTNAIEWWLNEHGANCG